MELKSQIWIEYQIRMKVLIVPLWNWNADAEAFNLDDKFVLIVPLWNWNLDVSNFDTSKVSFNRTFMELKCSTALCCDANRSFNRTFMELKL